MEPIVIRKSWLRSLLLVIVGFAMTGGGVFIILVKPADKWIGLFTVFFFGACTLVAVQRLLDSRPRLVIDDHGIYDRTLGVGRIPWSEITGAEVRSIQGNEFVSVYVRDARMLRMEVSPLRNALNAANRALGFSEFNINLSGLAIDANQLQELIVKRSEAARRHTSV